MVMRVKDNQLHEDGLTIPLCLLAIALGLVLALWCMFIEF